MRTDCAAPPTSPPARYRPLIWRRASTGPGRLWCRHDALLRDLGLQGRPHDRHHRRSNRGHPLPPERARPDTRGTQPHALAGTRTTLRHLPCLPAVNHPALPGIPASGPARTAARWHRPKARPTIGPGCSPAISSFRAPRACSSDSELRPSRCISLYTEPRGSPTAAPAGPPPGALQAQHAGQLSLLPLPLPAGHLRLLGRLGLVTLTGGHLAGPGLGRPRTRSSASRGGARPAALLVLLCSSLALPTLPWLITPSSCRQSIDHFHGLTPYSRRFNLRQWRRLGHRTARCRCNTPGDCPFYRSLRLPDISGSSDDSDW